MANTTGKKIKDVAIIGGCASLIYLTIGVFLTDFHFQEEA